MEAVKEFQEEQNVEQIGYAIKKYQQIIDKATALQFDCRTLERDIPTSPKDGYEIILIELETLVSIITNRRMMDNAIVSTNDNSKSCLSRYIKQNKGIQSKFGEIQIDPSDCLGQGGNGMVYKGVLNGKEIVIKFLVNYNSDKHNRFKAEYFNLNLKRDNLINIINNIDYDELITEEGKFPYIIMKKYCKSLREYYNEAEDIGWEDIKRVYNFFITTLLSIHNENIIHRDIKPENILIDENNNYILADFGISRFEKEDFPITNDTKQSDRLANFEFSAPEQINSKKAVTFATDIYSMAQIIYWLAFGEVHKGTGIKRFKEKFKHNEAIVMSRIVEKCLQNNMEDRFQTIDEIKVEYDRLFDELNIQKTYDPFPDMYLFADIMNSTNPNFYNNVSYIDDVRKMKLFFDKLNDTNFNRKIWFNAGIGNNTISEIKHLENGNFTIDTREIGINRIWGITTDNVYDDICILELKPVAPYIINGEEYFGIAKINDEKIVPVEKIASGYVEINDHVYNVRDLKIEERYIYNDYKYIVLCTLKQCCQLTENDGYIEELQKESKLTREIILELKKNISKNIADEVSMMR